jgi:hypothetical protein
VGSATAAIRSALLVVPILLFSGCPSSQEVVQSTTREDHPSASVRRAEETFNPSDYDPVPRAPRGLDTSRVAPSELTDRTTPLQTADELTPGYRVQIISTTSIDEADAKKSLAESLFPSEWFYIQYDAPSYKIRAGNFRVRLDADRFRSLIAARGFPDAWVVPERVFKNPQPPPPRDIPSPQK